MKMRIAAVALFAMTAAAHGQSAGTLNLSGPSSGGSIITPATVNAAINAALAAKADASNPVITGGTISGADVSGANVTATGGNTARTPANRSTDVVNVLDFGAKGDGTTDDTAAIERARVAANGHADLYLPPGKVFRTSGTVLKSNDHITIDGTLKQLDGVDTSTITAFVASNIVIDGHGTVDGDAAGNPSPASPMACINIKTVTNAHISGLHVTNCVNWPINVFLNSANVYLSDMELDNSGNSAECSTTTICEADNLYIHDISDYGWSFYGGVVDGKITNSTVANSDAGFNALDDAAQPLPDNRLIFANNRATGNQGPGFSTLDTNNLYPAHTNVVFIGNISDHNNKANSNNNYGGYYIDWCYSCSLTGNLSDHNGNGTNTTPGYYIAPHTKDVMLTGNISADEGQGGTLGVGFGIASGAINPQFVGNHAVDDQTTKTMAFGYNGTFSTSRGVAIGNTSTPMIGAAFNWVLASDTLSCNVPTGGTVFACTAIQLNSTAAPPTCSATYRGTEWVTQGSAGTKDTLQVCAKDATDAYAWRTLY